MVWKISKPLTKAEDRFSLYRHASSSFFPTLFVLWRTLTADRLQATSSSKSKRWRGELRRIEAKGEKAGIPGRLVSVC